MSWPLIINPEAEADLAEAKTYYDGRQFGLGDEFWNVLRKCLSASVRRRNGTPRYIKTYGGHSFAGFRM